MDKLTQSSAANSEESASAAQELSAQVSELRGMVSKFKLYFKRLQIALFQRSENAV
jgi:hypothetical protein